MSSDKQSSDSQNKANASTAGTGTGMSIGQKAPTSTPGNIKPAGTNPSGSSQGINRGPQGNA